MPGARAFNDNGFGGPLKRRRRWRRLFENKLAGAHVWAKCMCALLSCYVGIQQKRSCLFVCFLCAWVWGAENLHPRTKGKLEAETVGGQNNQTPWPRRRRHTPHPEGQCWWLRNPRTKVQNNQTFGAPRSWTSPTLSFGRGRVVVLCLPHPGFEYFVHLLYVAARTAALGGCRGG